MNLADRILDGLNPEQRRAVEALNGPVCILAGAGAGKTTTITRRIANQVTFGGLHPKNILAVTFTTKAAGEMGERLAKLGVVGVPAKTFHAAALSQLSVLGDRSYDVIPSKIRFVKDAATVLPAEFRLKPLPDLAQEIERAKNLRISPDRYEAEVDDGAGPIPPGPMAKLYARYEELKRNAGKVDFEDLLAQAISMFESNERTLARFKARYLAITVDEYQDVNLLQQTLLDRWLDGRDELCVVGDDYQAIYSFTGATPRYLIAMPDRYPGTRVIRLETNYRSTPQVLEFANRLVPRLGGTAKTLRATKAAGPKPTLRSCAGSEAELAAIVAEIRRLRAENVPHEEMAVLYRINYRSAEYEEALHAARIPFQVAGGGFLERPATKGALRQLQGLSIEIVETVERVCEQAQFIRDPDPNELTPAELTRQRDLARLIDLAREFAGGERTVRDFVAHLRDRFDGEQPRAAVRLMTYHASKGLEFDAVFLPRLEQRELPFYKALDGGTLAEERRLFYVGLTRSRRHLHISWDGKRNRSQFLDEIQPAATSKPKPKPPSSTLRGGKPAKPKGAKTKRSTKQIPSAKQAAPKNPKPAPKPPRQPWEPRPRTS